MPGISQSVESIQTGRSVVFSKGQQDWDCQNVAQHGRSSFVFPSASLLFLIRGLRHHHVYCNWSLFVHSVAVVAVGLRPIESYLQLFDALEHLDRTVGDVYGKLSERVRFACTQLCLALHWCLTPSFFSFGFIVFRLEPSALNCRIFKLELKRQRYVFTVSLCRDAAVSDTASLCWHLIFGFTMQSKVRKITGSTKATTVYSPAKYPAPKKLEPFQPVFPVNATAAPPPMPLHSRYRLNIAEHPHVCLPRVAPTQKSAQKTEPFFIAATHIHTAL